MPAKPQKVKQSLRASFWDGFFASIQFGIVEQFAVPLALFLGANSAAIGILNFVRNAFVSIIQVESADLTNWLRSRKKLILISVFLAAFLWLPTYFLPFLFPNYKVAVFIVFFALASAFNMLPTPAWASLMAEYIPHNKRGTYFGWRSSVMGIVYTGAVLLAGLVLYFARPIGLFWGFAFLILVASLSRFISFYFLTKMYEPKWRVASTDYFSLYSFLIRIKQSNFARFVVLASLFVLAVALVSPFFALYLLQDLRYDYLSFTLVIGAAVVTTFVTQRYWGGLADTYGNMKLIRLTVFLISLLPFLWLFSRSFAYLFVVQLFGGFVWAGFNLSSTNFIYDAAVSNKRERCIAYYNFLSGLGLAFGALLGGFLYRNLPLLAGYQFYSLLIISGLLRFVFALAIFSFTKEVRAVQDIRVRTLLFGLSGLRAVGLLSRELIYRRK
ncbi:MAG: MFS transporter, partial [bacterium]